MKLNFLKDYISLRPPRAFGVDFNNDAIKILQIKNRGKFQKISGWSKKGFPKGTLENFEIQQQEQFIEVLKDAVQQADGQIKGNSVVVSIPESKVFIRIINIPLMEEKEASEAIKWETESNIPISIDEVYFDWQIVEKLPDGMKVLILACPKRVVDNYLETFEKAGFSVLALEAESVATGRSVLQKADQSPTIIIDLGLENTSYAIYQKGFPVFTSSSSISGKMMTDSIAKGLQIDSLKAESLKLKIGLGQSNQEDTEMLGLLKPILATLIGEIERAIMFYEEKLISSQEQKIEKVILCGGGSNLNGLSSYLTVNLKRTVHQANPWENFHFAGDLPPISMEESQGFITAIGLALRAQEYEDYH